MDMSLIADDEFIKAALAFERAWEVRMMGDETVDLRFMLGMLCAKIVGRGVKKEDLVEYVSAVVLADGVPPSVLKGGAMITECICEVEGCGERARFSHSMLPSGWSFLVTFEKPKLPKGMPRFPVELDDMVLRQHAHVPRMRKRAICGKHELPKLVIYDGGDDEDMLGVMVP